MQHVSGFFYSTSSMFSHLSRVTVGHSRSLFVRHFTVYDTATYSSMLLPVGTDGLLEIVLLREFNTWLSVTLCTLFRSVYTHERNCWVKGCTRISSGR